MRKAHEYWSMGAFACMLMTMASGYDEKLRKTHKYWALGTFGCMAMSVYTGHKMIHRKPSKPVSDNLENTENIKNEGDNQNG